MNKIEQLQQDKREEEIKRLTFHLEQIASGAARDSQTQAKVALGQLPIGALLTPADAEEFCRKCHNHGKTTKGQGANAGQKFGCPGCGYLEGEHPNGPKKGGARIEVNAVHIQMNPEPQIVLVPVDRGGGGGMRA